VANPGAAAKNAQKAAANAGKAASKADAPKARSVGGGGAPDKAKAVDWVERGNQLGVDSVAARQLDEEYIPQLQDAGYSNSQIKSIFLAEDPHSTAKQFIDDEKLKLMESIGASNYGYTPDQMLGMSLKQLRETDSSIKEGASRPSRIRGKDPNASDAVESRVPGEETARADAPMGATPGEVPPVVPQPSQRKISAEKAARLKASEASKANVAKVKETGSLEGIEWNGANRDPMIVGKDASKGDWSKLTAEDMTGERGPVFKSQPAEPAKPASPGIQPATKDEVAQKVDGAADQKAQNWAASVSKTDPIVRAVAAAPSAVAGAFRKYPGVSTAATVVGLPVAGLTARYGIPMAYRGLSNLYGAAFGEAQPQQPAPSQPSQQGQGGQPVQINILSRERLRELQRPPVQQPAPMPPAQPPMQQPQPQAQPGQTTDIIRQLAGRMA
jgi:hypothetical protein